MAITMIMMTTMKVKMTTTMVVVREMTLTVTVIVIGLVVVTLQVMWIGAGWSSPEILQLLIDVGGDVNASTRPGKYNITSRPPLFIAQINNAMAAMHLLLAHPYLDLDLTFRGDDVAAVTTSLISYAVD